MKNNIANPLFHRSRLLLGDDVMQKFQDTKVILFGVGGVGSWCAEALIRSGIGHLTIVDNDAICVTNINRQLQATSGNIGEVKVDVLKKRLLDINPDADVDAICRVYNHDTASQFNLSEFDYVIDAIDTLACKIELISQALASDTTLFSAMGAACRLNSLRVQVSSIWGTDKCKLAKLVRKRLRQNKVEGDFLCVWSDEVRPSGNVASICGSDKCFCPHTEGDGGGSEPSDTWCGQKAVINGSMVHITGTFGFTLAGLVFQDLANFHI